MARNKKRGKGIGGIIVSLFLLAGLGGGGWYLYNLPELEREKPVIEGPDNIFWNRIDPLKITLKDNVGLSSYALILSDGEKSVIIGQGALPDNRKEQTLSVKYPKGKVLNPKAKHFTLKVTATDSSMWNMMAGNTAQKTLNINVDYKRPNVNIVANSRMINQGGSALVIFQAEDDNMDKLYIEANGNKFKPQPYKKEGYYAALIAWPFTDDTFTAKIIATDLAKNKRITKIPFYHKNPRYKTSYIRASDNFIDGKIKNLKLLTRLCV